MHRGARCRYLPGGARAAGPCGRPGYRRPAYRRRTPAPGAHGAMAARPGPVGDRGTPGAGARLCPPARWQTGIGAGHDVGYWQGCGFLPCRSQPHRLGQQRPPGRDQLSVTIRESGLERLRQRRFPRDRILLVPGEYQSAIRRGSSRVVRAFSVSVR